MQCLILAGGLGTRIKTISGDKPKALIPIGTQTFIDWQLQWLKIIGVTDVVMALGYGGEQIVNHIEERQSSAKYPQVNYSFDGPVLLGTGGAIKNAQAKLSKDFLVTYGDTILFLDVKKLIVSHLESQKPVTLSILKNKDVGDKSNVIFKEGKPFYDKFNVVPEMEYIDYGMSVVNKKYFLENTPEGKFDYSTFLNESSKRGDMGAFVVTEWFQEIGSPKGYEGFCNTLQSFEYDLRKMAQEKVF